VDVSIACVTIDRVEPALLDRYRALLPDDERARAQALRHDGARRAFVIGRALVRTALSRRHPAIAPAAWRIELGAWGRPELAAAHGVALSFNLSHTTDAVALAVARGRVGVDLERVTRPAPLDVAAQYFSSAERAALARVPEAERARRFFVTWTLKEAYVKARGTGLQAGLDRFTIELSHPPVVHDDRAGAWQLRAGHWREHALAVAVEAAAPPAIHLVETVPLVDGEAPAIWQPW